MATVLSAVNAIPPARTPTSCAAARAGKCPYFVVKMLYSVLSLILHMFTVNSSKINFLRCIKPKRGSVTNYRFAVIWSQLVKNRKVYLDETILHPNLKILVCFFKFQSFSILAILSDCKISTSCGNNVVFL